MAQYESINEQTISKLSDLTTEVQKQILSQWTTEVLNWLSRARLYVANTENFANTLTKESSKIYTHINDILKRKRVAVDKIKNDVILNDGYILLNKIGEQIRGEEIFYSITTTATGEALSKGPAATGEVYTWQVPLATFLNMVNFSAHRITLKAPATIQKMMLAQLNEEGITYEKWSEEKLNNYSLFMGQAKSVAHGKWAKVNEGNILEAFLRYIDGEQCPRIPERGEREYWHSIASAMKQTMSNPDAFYLGGDLYDKQIKGLQASVTNINTLIVALEATLEMLMQLPDNKEIVRSSYRKNFAGELDRIIEQDQEVVIKNLIEYFTTNVDRMNLTF